MTIIKIVIVLSTWEYYDNTSVVEVQSKQWSSWESFPNPLLLCLLLCMRTPSPFLLCPGWRRCKILMGLTWTSLSGSSWSFSWIQTTHLKAPSTPDSLLSSRMDAILRRLHQVQGYNKIQMFETLSCLSKQGCNMIQIFESLGLVLLNMHVSCFKTCYFSPGTHGTYFPVMNKY
jgi:hypothetical protein